MKKKAGIKLAGLVWMAMTAGCAWAENGGGAVPLATIQTMVAHELSDRLAKGCWQYKVAKTQDQQSFLREQIESKDGPVYRETGRNGRALNEQERQEEKRRLDRLMQDPVEQRRVKQRYDADEERLVRLTKLLPEAFVFTEAGEEGGNVRLKFEPKPGFSPPSYEARVYSAMAGTIVIDPKQLRMVKLEGRLIHPVEFGFGLLGHIDEGGTFEIDRMPVSATHWKTSLVDVHVAGKVILFKTVARQQREVRSEFRALPAETSLEDARRILEAGQ